MDIVTIEFQTRSYGASLRAGPVKAGLNYQSARGASFGLRGGDAGSHNSEELTVFFVGRDIFRKTAPASLEEGVPASEPETEPAADAPADRAPPDQAEKSVGVPTAAEADLPGQRGKSVAAFSPFGTTLPAYKKRSLFHSTKGLSPAYYYTQIELSVGLFAGLRIGINPGELVDALAGIFRLDPFSDDEPFKTEQERALEENPAYRGLSEEQKRLFREQMSKQSAP